MVLIQGRMLAVTINADSPLPVRTPKAIEAASRIQPMLQMKAAALEVPAPGLAWLAMLNTPQMNERLLEQFSLHRWISSHPGRYLFQRFKHFCVFDQHNSSPP